jgi:hypothetical protein
VNIIASKGGLKTLEDLYLLERPLIGSNIRYHSDYSYVPSLLFKALSLKKVSVRVPGMFFPPNNAKMLDCDWEPWHSEPFMHIPKLARIPGKSSLCRMFVHDENQISCENICDRLEFIQKNRFVPLPNFCLNTPNITDEMQIAVETARPVSIKSVYYRNRFRIVQRQPRHDDWPGQPVDMVSSCESNVRLIEEYVKRIIVPIPNFVFSIRYKPNVLLMFQNGLLPVDLSPTVLLKIMEEFAKVFMPRDTSRNSLYSFWRDNEEVAAVKVKMLENDIEVEFKRTCKFSAQIIPEKAKTILKDLRREKKIWRWTKLYRPVAELGIILHASFSAILEASIPDQPVLLKINEEVIFFNQRSFIQYFMYACAMPFLSPPDIQNLSTSMKNFAKRSNPVLSRHSRLVKGQAVPFESSLLSHSAENVGSLSPTVMDATLDTQSLD